jgi:hypothetical protein
MWQALKIGKADEQSVPLEKLYCALVGLGLGDGRERSQITALSRLGILLA